MSTQQISRRYARALFELIEEGVALEQGVQQLAAAVSVEGAEAFFASPAIDAAKKAEVLKKAVPAPAELHRLVDLLSERNKLLLLPEIAEMVADMVRQSKAETVADVTVAAPLKADAQKKVAAALEKSMGRKVSLNVTEDPSILGGMVIRIGDRQIDYSLRTRLDAMRRAIAG